MSLNNLFYELNRKMAFCKLPLNRSLSLNQDYTVHTTLQQNKKTADKIEKQIRDNAYPGNKSYISFHLFLRNPICRHIQSQFMKEISHFNVIYLWYLFGFYYVLLQHISQYYCVLPKYQGHVFLIVLSSVFLTCLADSGSYSRDAVIKL